jgi:regulator of replication initiation timing
MNISVLLPLAALIGGPLIAYFGVARRASGKIATSEASQLWEESRSIREWATNRISELNATVAKLQGQIELLEKRNTSLSLENGRLTALLDEQGKTITEMREQLHRVSEENVALRRDNTKMRKRITELEGQDGPK